MSRGFDGFEIDDFRGTDSGPDRDVDRRSSADWNKWTELHNIHREEERADRLDRKAPDRSNRDQWSDVDFGTGAINLSRGIVHQHVGEMKTEASQKPVPMDGALATALLEWSGQTPYRQPGDWVFASPKMNGKQPYWPETLPKCYVQPIAKRLSITKKIGWHTFRRTLATLLTGCDENAKTTQELMRHANAGITMNLYAQALTPAKRAAHLKLVGLIHPAAETAIGPLWSHAEDAVAVSS